jgi:hypothetical protein
MVRNRIKTNSMTKKEYLNKLAKKFPYAYSLVPDFMWSWIYDNLINKQL